MNCPNRNILSDLLDGALPAFDTWKLRRHLKHCPHCATVFQEEQHLRDRVRGVGANASAPILLRYRVRSAIYPTGALPVEKPRPISLRGEVIAAVVVCLVLAVVCLPLLTLLLRPQPAYAQVVDAMRQVKTASWREICNYYNASTGRTSEFELRFVARVNPPLLKCASPNNKFITLGPWLKVDTADSNRKWRDHILSHLGAPAAIGKGPNAWHSTRVVVDGKTLLCFTAGMGQGRKISPEQKMTAPGYRSVLWVDPRTSRVVRSLKEYYDGKQHDITVGSDFRYNVPFPEDK